MKNYESALSLFVNPDYINSLPVETAKEKEFMQEAIVWFKNNKKNVVEESIANIEHSYTEVFSVTELEYLATTSKFAVFKKLFEVSESKKFQEGLLLPMVKIRYILNSKKIPADKKTK